MSELSWQILALALLAGGVFLGYRRWIRPRREALTRPALGVLVLLVLTLMGGLLGGPPWWLDAPQSFSWDLPPLASRMLASAGWAFAVLCALALERPTWRRVRLALLMLEVYLLPLVVAILLFHLERFDFSAPITYAFFLIAGGISLAGLVYFIRQPEIAPDPARDAVPSSGPVKIWLGLVAAVMAGWGLALFATDSGPSALIWVWPGDLLTSRLIAAMLWAIAAGALYALPRLDTTRVMLFVAIAYGAGVSLANAWNTLAGRPVQLSYLVAFTILALVSAIVLLLAPPPRGA